MQVPEPFAICKYVHISSENVLCAFIDRIKKTYSDIANSVLPFYRLSQMNGTSKSKIEVHILDVMYLHEYLQNLDIQRLYLCYSETDFAITPPKAFVYSWKYCSFFKTAFIFESPFRRVLLMLPSYSLLGNPCFGASAA